MTDKCRTRGCNDDAKTAGFCGPCYAFQNYWRKRSVGHRMAHAAKLQKNARRRRDQLLVDVIPGRKVR